MYNLFIEKIKASIHPDEEGLEIIQNYLIPKKLRKRQYLLQEGDVCKYNCFVEKGALKAYILDEKANEHIVQFAFEGCFISDLASMMTGDPSSYNIEAMEDSELVLLTNKAHHEIIKKVPCFEYFVHSRLQSAYIDLQNRLIDIISLSGEKKYNNLINKYPEITQRVPQHMLASYLGLSAETLSRIRSQSNVKK